jgi:hypothetical protein
MRCKSLGGGPALGDEIAIYLMGPILHGSELTDCDGHHA